ncbi:MAG: endopeptidase La [Firmicutes bacterium]|uniref:Lon protease n=1 Tax=Candidatus Colimorpha enterica TaxID=3083063 RepID=A0AAE3FJZ2_9BACT|nr:endopeptidase La [Candidatus Colimorpha enterica]MDY2905944.1 endopeptidase La [Eubacteriales bacterium]
MPKYIEKAERMHLPALAMRGLIAFPAIPLTFEVADEADAGVCLEAEKNDGVIFIVSLRDLSLTGTTEENLYSVGTVVKIKQTVKLPEGNLKVFAAGICRATAENLTIDDSIITADVIGKDLRLADKNSVKAEALVAEMRNTFDSFSKLMPKPSNELVTAIKSLSDPGLLADFIAGSVLMNYVDKQMVLEEFDPMRRAELVCLLMERESDILRTEMNIHKKVRAQLDANQRDYYLKEQLRAIRDELGENEEEEDEEIVEYNSKIAAANLPDEVREKLVKEVKKLAKTPYTSAESSVMRNYLDLCLELPWGVKSKDRIDVAAAKKILDEDHDGLDRVKERILEFIAVKQLNPELKNQVLCLVGPPGTGKTSIGASVARALKRKYVRVSLGGVRDEADIRGHRKTYIAAMPGRIVTAINQAGTMNPVILLDEIDKLTRDAHGDPASALLEVLDAEQNKAFRDHFVELPVDLSDCLFIATANDMENIPRPLADRMEIIELKIYTRHEKLAIAKDHLIPKQLKRHGLNKRMLRIKEDAVLEIIDFYTREAGVRNLEREIASVCRKAAKNIVGQGLKSVTVKAENVKDYLGVRKILPDKIYSDNEVGVVNGLAYTEVGGDLLRVEAAAMPGSGKVELTGSLGDVMKESAKAAITYIRSHSEELGIDSEFYKTKDIHIHVPEGAVPKDGPSAGVTIITALASELSGKPVRRDIAMTGEVTLRGRVLAIGGLKEKTMAAYKAGVHTVCIPSENQRDLSEIDPLVRENLEFIPCSNVDQVLKAAIVR